jgi:hypothetical protein
MPAGYSIPPHACNAASVTTHLLYTYCNDGKGDFLIEHWLESLRLNVSLSKIDVMVIDFGLSPKQRAILQHRGVLLWPGVADGRMSNVQYRHLAEFLRAHPAYDQVCYADCGDLVFQADISNLFERARAQFKVALEPDFNFGLHKLTLGLKDFKPDKLSEVERVLGRQPTANCGFLIGPASEMAGIWTTYTVMCKSADVHGTDQLLINYIIRCKGFDELPRRYNYVLFLNAEHFYYDADNILHDQAGIVPVVHNAGQHDFARTIADFGYRQGRIKPRLYPFAIRCLYRVLDVFYGVALGPR